MDFSLKIVWVRAIWKSGSKLQDNKEKNENEVKIKPMQLPSSRNYVFGLGVLQLILASKLGELEQFENLAANY